MGRRTKGASAFIGAAIAVSAPAQAQTGQVPDMPDQTVQTTSADPQSPATQTSAPSVNRDTGDIVVTAQRREQGLQKVPVSVTAITGDRLAALGIKNAVDLAAATPSLVVRDSDPTSVPLIFLRGVGSNDFNPNTASPIAVYVDGVYVGSQAGQFGAYTDLARTEVLRGPQGTLYGRNTTGGAINVISARPTFDTEGFAQVDAGNYRSVDATGAIGGAIIKDVLAVRVSGEYEYDQGYAYNRLDGDPLSGLRKAYGRVAVLFKPSGDLEFLGHVSWMQANSSVAFQSRGLVPQTAAATGADGLCKPAYYGTAACTNLIGYADTDNNPYAGDYYSDSPTSSRDFRADLTSMWHIGKVSLIAVTGYDYGRTFENTDVVASPVPLLTAIYGARDRQFSQELRLQSDTTGRLNWVLGGFYLHDKVVNSSAYDILGALRPLFITPTNPTGASLAAGVGYFGYPSVQVTNSYAAFGQAEYKLTDKLTLTGGLRYSVDRKRLDYAATFEDMDTLFTTDQAKSFGDISGRAAIEYQFNPNAMAYASYNRGYRSGGFFAGYATDPSQITPYKNETLNAYEAGTKLALFNKHLRVNLSGFYYDYQNLQVFTLVQRGSITVQILNNAANARIYGGEAEFTYSPVKGVEFISGLSLLSAKYRNFLSDGQDLSGNRLPGAPRFTYNGGIHIQHEIIDQLGIEATANARYTSKTFFETQNLPRLAQAGYWVFDGRLGITSAQSHLGAGVWVRNLFDKRYLTNVSEILSLGVDALAYAAPRTLGGYVKWNF